MGVLKAGGGYLPLEVSYPAARLRFMLADARVSVLLTQSHLIEKMPAHDVQVICLDREWDIIAQESDANLSIPISPENLAYIIYTSGSTGTPKGVMVQHGSLANYTMSARLDYALTPADRVLQAASICFDFSADEIYPCLTSGAALVLRTESTFSSTTAYLEQCQNWGITFILPPTAFLHELAAAFESTSVPFPDSIRLVVIGGEKVLPDKLMKWSQHVGRGVQLMNTYGPTEATIVSTACDLSALTDENARRHQLPIGRPVRNVQTYVLDDRLEPLPVGVPGELHIAGAGLARGYLNQPAVTAERFIPNPFSSQPGARMYRSGDLARYQPDGNLDYIRRVDQQVKIRGFRVELGEIEAALNQHPAIHEAAVIAHEYSPGDQRLVAYLALKAGIELSLDVLRAALKSQLPEYMIPAAFVSLDQLPKTDSNKIDRRRLPAPDPSRSELASGYVAPRDGLELELARIWEELLNVRPIGVRENFFELGGHSLLAVRLMARIERLQGRGIALPMLFKAPTIESQAMRLRQEAQPSRQEALVRLQAGNGARPLFFVHPVGGNVFCYLDLARHLGPDQPIYALQTRLGKHFRPLHRRVEQMAAAYLKAIRKVQPHGPYQLSGWSMGGVIAFEMARQLAAAGQQVALLALIDAFAPTLQEDTGKVDNRTLLYEFTRDLGIPLSQPTFSSDQFARLNGDEQLASLLETAKREHLVPPDIDLAQARRLFDVFRNNARAMRRYVPPVNANQVILLRAAEGTFARADHSAGWKAFAAQEVVVDYVPGDHYSLLREPHVSVLAEKIKSYL
jgi:amino acid adenylation domain-containing protein